MKNTPNLDKGRVRKINNRIRKPLKSTVFPNNALHDSSFIWPQEPVHISRIIEEIFQDKKGGRNE